jgi:hypothetical protein
MTPTRYFQLAASPGLSLPGLHPHLQGLPGFPVGSQMVPNGTMGERFLSQTALFLPSVSYSSVLQQLCCSRGPFPQSNSLPLHVRYSAWSMGMPGGQMAAH